MGANGKRGGGDRVLESRHLVGLFLGVVLLCGVFFTLGYVMGHSQDSGAVHASDAGLRTPPVAANPKPKQPETPAATPPEWDFYKKNENTHLEPAVKPAAPPSAPALAGKSEPAAAPAVTVAAPATKNVAEPVVKAPARFQAPRMLKGAIVLQLAALRQESDALAMADAVQQKKFPSFVVAPTSDNLYRVQVGPYATEQLAEAAKAALERAGFKAILKR
jgi:cell division septation protein DedD